MPIDEGDLPRRMKSGAERVARAAKANAGFSKRIPLATRVKQYSTHTDVVTHGNEAPNAAPFEAPLDHPLFARRGTKRYEDSKWYRQPHRPFMQRALDSEGDRATDDIGNVVDDWGHDLGFTDR